MIALLLAIHLAAAVFWVGGMGFAHAVLRPAAMALEPPVRLALWRRVLSGFLPWAGVSALALVVSGFAMIGLIFGGFSGTPVHVHIMATLGLVMAAIYLHLLFAPWRRFRAAVDTASWPLAAEQLAQIRRLVTINLVLGIVTILVGGTGRYW